MRTPYHVDYLDKPSPWQKLVMSARMEKTMSYTDLTNATGIKRSTLIDALKSPRGHMLSYDEERNEILARALGLKPMDLMMAHKQSVLQSPDVAPPVKALKEFITLYPSASIPKSLLLKLLE